MSSVKSISDILTCINNSMIELNIQNACPHSKKLLRSIPNLSDYTVTNRSKVLNYGIIQCRQNSRSKYFNPTIVKHSHNPANLPEFSATPVLQFRNHSRDTANLRLAAKGEWKRRLAQHTKITSKYKCIETTVVRSQAHRSRQGTILDHKKTSC